MNTRLRHLARDERGMSFVFVGIGLTTFLAATTLAIDVGMFMTARSQAQNAADAGALAGATALLYDSYDDRTASGPAVQSAINTALANTVINSDVSVTAQDVTFPVAPSGEANRVRVDVFRAQGRQNAVPTLIGALFGVETVNIGATATAEAAPANAMTCVKPFTIPDRWVENSNGPWNPDSTFDRYDSKGDLLPNADVYVPPGQPGYNGYDPIADKGVRLMLRAGTGNNIAPSFYYSWKMPGGTGADFYRENIAACNAALVHYGDDIVQEPGNMVGPTIQGVDELIASDPDAYWDTTSNSVVSTMSSSPRVFPIPLYDPEYYSSGKTNSRNADLRVANWIGFFVEGRQGNNVYGRITPILGIIDDSAGPAPTGMFPLAIRLIE